jgi:hypothetical protein
MNALYINLDRRTDRRQQFEEECGKLNLSVERFPAVDRTPGALGCAHSHRNALRLAKERGYPAVMIFEDDFEFLVSRREFHDILTHLPEDYDVVMLSYDLQKSEPYNERFGRVLEVQSASGYIVSSKFYDTLLATWDRAVECYEKEPYCHWLYINDQSWKPLQPISRWYYSLIRVGKQRPSWSDLSQAFVDYGK